MAEPKGDKKDVLYKKKYLETIGKRILNNEQLKDVTFVVNKKQYHASRIHVSAASQVFASLLNEHFANTTDKELVLRNIKHNDSFFNILQYIHGIELNLTTMSKLVLCEILDLSKRFKLAELHDDLKALCSNITQFELNTIVIMLNTARTYNLTKLYDKLQDYVYQHAEQVVNHKTFVDLKYDVLVDLLKSNWLYAKETDILRAALNWHDDNIIDPAKLIDIESNIALGLAGQDSSKQYNREFINQSEISDQVGKKLSQIHENDSSEAVSNSVDKVDDSDKSNDVSDENKSLPKPEINESEHLLNKEKIVVENISKNVLNTLFGHIRFFRITMFEYVTIANEEPFKKYRDIILSKQFSDFNKDPRHLYKEPKNDVLVLLFTVTHIKDLRKSSSGTPFYSSLGTTLVKTGTHSLNLHTWSIRATKNKQPGTSDTHLGLYLSCYSGRNDWKVDVSCQLTVRTHQLNSGTNISRKVDNYTFENTGSPEWGWNKFVNFSTLYNPSKGLIQDDSITVEVLLKVNYH